MRKPPPMRLPRPKVRDDLLVDLINGATKAGVETDRKKEESKRKCRKKVQPEENES